MNNLCAVCRVLLGNEFYVETFTTELILTVSHTTVGDKLCLLIYFKSFLTLKVHVSTRILSKENPPHHKCVLDVNIIFDGSIMVSLGSEKRLRCGREVN